jgi:hypothetical protein
MEKHDNFHKLLNLPKTFSRRDFDEYIVDFLKCKLDKNIALQDLDNIIGTLQNHIFLLSLHLKQHYILLKSESKTDQQLEYTKKEVAKKFRVSTRTVSNWIYEGLKTTEIGGIIRISEQALDDFQKNHKTKKFNWASTGNVPYKKAA